MQTFRQFPMERFTPRQSERSGWSEEEKEKLPAMFLSGKSLTEIAKALKRTRCAVAGKAFRMGLFHKRGKASDPRPAKPAKEPKASSPEKVADLVRRMAQEPRSNCWPIDQKAVRESHPVSLLEAKEHHCRWPLENGLFCGGDRARGAFCREHGARAYTKFVEGL